LILLALIATYVFGREYAEVTAKNMIALPVRRDLFVWAKLVVVFVWYAAVMTLLVAENFVVGFALGLPGFSVALAVSSVAMIAAIVGMCFLLVSPTAWIATLGRGYLPPIGFAIITLALGNIFALTGWSVWFPWSIPPLFAGAAGKGAGELAAISLIALVVTFALGVAATIAQLRYADNAQ
jgi:ABC-2 type transport system permease protein